MKIVELEDFFHPDAGYQINVLSKVLASRGHEVVIICSTMDKAPDSLIAFFGREGIEARDRAYEQETGVRIVRVPAKRYISGRWIFGKELDYAVERENPDLLFVHGNDTWNGMKYALSLKHLKWPVVFDSHMLEIASVNPLAKVYRKAYKSIISPAINKTAHKVIRVQDDPYVIDSLGIAPENAPFISFGTDTELFKPNSETRKCFDDEYGLAGGITILYAGKLDEAKGAGILTKAIQRKIKSPVPVSFVIVGNTNGADAALIEKQFTESENRILRFPTQRYRDLARFYASADVALYPAQCSLSFFDAQSSGLPVIVDDSTPINIERVSHGNGMTFTQGSAESLRETIEAFISLPNQARDAMSASSRSFINQSYSYQRIVTEYEKVFEEEIERFERSKRND